MKQHNLQLIPREKILMGGPMNIFIRCINRGCIAGIDWCTPESSEKLLKEAKAKFPNNCPYKPKL